MQRRVSGILRTWLALSLCWTLAAGAIVLVQHQVLRQQADEPQAQLAEDAARRLDAGDARVPAIAGDDVAIENSLAPWLVVYDQAGAPRAGNGHLHGALPKLPDGVLAFARQHGGHRLSWQPEPGVRQALVVVPTKAGFVVAGRSLREVEADKQQVLHLMLVAWALGLAGLLLPVLLLLPTRNAG